MSPLEAVRRNSLVELIVIVALAIVLAIVVQALIVKPYRIPSGSMEPTLDIGQRVLVQRVTHRPAPTPRSATSSSSIRRRARTACPRHAAWPSRRQPVRTPDAGRAEQTFIKRVVALGGDTVAARTGS